MAQIEIPYLYTPRDYQLKLFDAFNSKRCNRALLRWSRRAGKDLTCFSYVVQAMFERPGTYYYFFPTYSQGRKVLWEGKDKQGISFLARIPEQFIAGKNDQQLMIKLTNGSIFRIIGSDDYDSIVGTNPVGMVFSEWAISRPQVWDFMSPILFENGGWAIFNGTPRGENHMFKMETANEANPNWFISEVQSMWPDRPNYYPVISQAQLQEERRSGKEEQILEQEYGVSYVSGLKGAYYSDQVIAARQDKRVGTYKYNSNILVDVFTDLGMSDDTVLWFRQIDGNRIIWIDYYENSNQGYDHYVKVLRDRGYNYGTVWLPHDGAHRVQQTALKNSEAFRRYLQYENIQASVRCADKINNKQLAINAVRSRFPRYHFDQAKCAIGLKKLSLYHRKWDEAHQCFMNTPEHDWTSHAADAMSTEALTAKINDGYTNSNLILPNIVTDFDPRG